MKSLSKDSVLSAYRNGLPVSNSKLYMDVSTELGISEQAVNKKVQVGNTDVYVSGLKRKMRWLQQDLKAKGLIKRVEHGMWSITKSGKEELTKLETQHHIIAANTDLGIIVWGDSKQIFKSSITQDIQLCFTSPPFIGIKRNYGSYNVKNEVEAYFQFLFDVLSPIRARMKDGASLAFNLPNDVYIPDSNGQRSTYLERLIILFEDELDLSLMDRIIWASNKPPAPYQATRGDQTHLKQSYEFIYWFSTNPKSISQFVSNQRILTPHSKSNKKLISDGGEKSERVNCDGKYLIRKGSFSNNTNGTLQTNLLNIGNYCTHGRNIKKHCADFGVPTHGAAFPLNLAIKIVNWLSTPHKGLVVDPFGGRLTLAKACEILYRQYITSELYWEYIRPALEEFKMHDGYFINPAFSDFSNFK